jgi:hypothetical protein
MYGCNRSCFVTPGTCCVVEDVSALSHTPLDSHGRCHYCAGIGHAPAYGVRAAIKGSLRRPVAALDAIKVSTERSTDNNFPLHEEAVHV